MIQGFEYAFEDIKTAINGMPVSVIEIQYGVERNHTNIHGKGKGPVAMGRGKKDATPGKITVLQSDFEALQAASPSGSDPTDWAPFDITVCYAPDGGVLITDVVPKCRVNKWEKGMKTEDDHMTIELSLTTGIPVLQIA